MRFIYLLYLITLGVKGLALSLKNAVRSSATKVIIGFSLVLSSPDIGQCSENLIKSRSIESTQVDNKKVADKLNQVYSLKPTDGQLLEEVELDKATALLKANKLKRDTTANNIKLKNDEVSRIKATVRKSTGDVKRSEDLLRSLRLAGSKPVGGYEKYAAADKKYNDELQNFRKILQQVKSIYLSIYHCAPINLLFTTLGGGERARRREDGEQAASRFEQVNYQQLLAFIRLYYASNNYYIRLDGLLKDEAAAVKSRHAQLAKRREQIKAEVKQQAERKRQQERDAKLKVIRQSVAKSAADVDRARKEINRLNGVRLAPPLVHFYAHFSSHFPRQYRYRLKLN